MTFPHRDDPAERLLALLDAGREPADDQAAATGRHARPPLVSVPLGLRDRKTSVSHPVVLTFLLVALLVGGLLGLRVVRARADVIPIPALSAVSATGSGATAQLGTGGEGAPGDSGGAPASPGAAVLEIQVHVVGQVKRPGVVRLRPGARVADAIDAAGGVTAKADLSSVNLARPVLDGEQVVVSRPGEATRGPGSPGAPAGSASPATPPKVSLNTADGPALDTLPGVGPVLAQRILDWRAQNGRFASIDQLGEVSGIGEKLLATLSPLVTL